MTTLVDVGRGVISERNELHGASWVDCTQAAAMRACADAGVVFPIADLDQEREALERADDRPDETGATMADIVTAMDRRYGYSGAAVTDLHVALRTPGYTLLVQGAYPQFPSIQRRWSPKFQGGHAVAYRVTSEIGGTLLDPLAPMGFAGDTVTPAVMEAFAWRAATTRAMRWLQPPQSSTTSGGTNVSIATAGVKLTSDHVATFSAATPYLDSPGGKSIGAGSRIGYVVPYIGDSASFAAVIVTTGLMYADKVPRPTIVYVPRSAVTVTAVPNVVTPVVDVAAAIAADRLKAHVTWQ